MARDPPKIGEGHAAAMLRQGLRELRGAMYTQSNVAQSPEYGLYGTRTPGEVAEARRSDGPELEEEPQRESVLDQRLQQLDRNYEVRNRDSKERDSQGLDKE